MPQYVPLTIGVELGRGWYAEEQIKALGNRPSGARMLKSLMAITYVDSTVQYIISNADWKRGRGPIIWDALHLGIIYDAGRETPGWDLYTFNASSWKAPKVWDISSTIMANATLTTMVHPQIRKIRQVTPKSMTKVVSANQSLTSWVVDLGENIHGWCSYHFLKGTAKRGTNLTFLHSERLNLNNGTITHAIQPLTKGAYEQTIYIFGNDSTSSTFEPKFVSYGFRYVQFSGALLIHPHLDDVTCWCVHTDLEVVGRLAFPSSIPAQDSSVTMNENSSTIPIEKILEANYNATVQTAEANWISFPTDCPHRERRGWLGDAQAAAETLMFTYDMAAPYIKWLDDIYDAASIMYTNWDFPTLAPNYGGHSRRSESPGIDVAWSSAFILIWDWSWRRYNDMELAARHLDTARAYLDFLAKYRDEKTHVLPVDWQNNSHPNLLGDWCAAIGVNGTGDVHFQARHTSGVFNTFYYIRTHEAWLRAHKALGRPPAEAKLYATRLAEARSGFNYAFFQRSGGHSIYADPAVAKTFHYTALSLYKHHCLWH
eukprot:TRINITY_DN856_c0_g2_i1.p1 TRINITY_DN856_c0_g2~~TRINITY_DN856_c0_g2_i1.p1  ORF type:complete len:550 (+),score=77.72 TRINITY_DN856_c0_g2_i1:24-1652(+)